MLNQINIVHEDLRIVQAFKRVQQIISSISIPSPGGNAGISNILFVDQVTGNDITAVVGSLVNKFQTIQGAFNRIQVDGIPDRVVFVSPGVYNENLIWPSVNQVTLQGSGVINTSVQGSVPANPTILFNSVAPVATAEIRDIKILQTTTYSIDIDGTLSSGASFTTALYIHDATIPAFMINDVNNVLLENIGFNISTIRNVSVFAGYQLNSPIGGLSLDYDPVLPLPSGGKIGYVLDSSTIAVLNPTKIVFVIATSSCNFTSGVVANLIDTATDHGELNIRSTIGGIPGGAGVVVTFNNNFAYHTIANFDLTTIECGFTASNIGGTQRALITARNAVFKKSTLPAYAITAGDLVNLDIKGAQFAQGQLIPTGTCYVDRSIYRTSGVIGVIGGTPIPIVPPFVNATDYSVVTELSLAQIGLGLMVGIPSGGGNKLFNQFIAVSNVPSVTPVEFIVIKGE